MGLSCFVWGGVHVCAHLYEDTLTCACMCRGWRLIPAAFLYFLIFLCETGSLTEVLARLAGNVFPGLAYLHPWRWGYSRMPLCLGIGNLKLSFSCLQSNNFTRWTFSPILSVFASWDRIWFCNLGWPRTHCVSSVSQVLRNRHEPPCLAEDVALLS